VKHNESKLVVTAITHVSPFPPLIGDLPNRNVERPHELYRGAHLALPPSRSRILSVPIYRMPSPTQRAAICGETGSSMVTLQGLRLNGGLAAAGREDGNSIDRKATSLNLEEQVLQYWAQHQYRKVTQCRHDE
jgi:hypothetical protein